MVIEKLVCLFMLSVHTSLFTNLRVVGGKKHILGTGWGNVKPNTQTQLHNLYANTATAL